MSVEIEQGHRDFIEANINDFETVKQGYVKNLDSHKMNMYEAIYRRYLDGGFVVTRFCAECVFNMMKRLVKFWEANK